MIKESFRKYLEEAIGCEKALVAFSAFDAPASVSVRRNPFKKGRTPEGREVAWCGQGRLLAERPQFTLDPHFHGGAYYVQDSSSMFVGHIFRTLAAQINRPAGRPVRVLDLCAAPGGKTTDLAASLREIFGDNYILVSNEIMKQRVGILADNVALWGDPNVVVTSDDPRAFDGRQCRTCLSIIPTSSCGHRGVCPSSPCPSLIEGCFHGHQLQHFQLSLCTEQA